jgi:hypothetical protein
MERSIYYRCKNCNKNIIEGNRLLHEQYCKDKEEPKVNQNSPHSYHFGDSNDYNVQNYPTLEDLGMIDNYKYCILCNNYYHANEYDDHKLSHSLNEENEEPDISGYEIVDRNEVVKQMEEDIIEAEKFKKIRKKEISAEKKIVNYLFNFNGRVPPIVRISI